MSAPRTCCGVDEAGRGPLAGPVVTAAVILDPARAIAGLADSKALTAAERERLAVEIKARARCWAIAEASAAEIDRINIRQATLLAMARAVAGLALTPDEALVDGDALPALGVPARAIVRGDALIAEISAASILAKVHRDALMVELDRRFPGYGFAQHKGYPTPAHRAALAALGPCPEHRVSFAPVRACLPATADAR